MLLAKCRLLRPRYQTPSIAGCIWLLGNGCPGYSLGARFYAEGGREMGNWAGMNWVCVCGEGLLGYQSYFIHVTRSIHSVGIMNMS